jgi:hypothetical protein
MAAKKKSTAKKKMKAKKPNKPSKAAFVRSLPADMPAKEVIAKAKEAGIELNDMTVYKTRSLANRGAKGKRAGAAKKKASAKAVSTSPNARGRSPDKKNRVLDLAAKNPAWSADQVAKAAKCSTNYVYSVWRTKEPKPPGSKQAGRASGNGAVTDFYRVLKKVGVDKAKELIANIEAFQNA